MADQRDDAQERTEQATPKRLQDARRKGQVPRSRELTTVSLLLASGGGFMLLGPAMLSDLGDLMTRSFRFGPDRLTGGIGLLGELQLALLGAVELLGPFLVLTLAAALLAPMALGGWSFSVQAMSFKTEKLDPIKGMKRVFAWRGLMELVKALAKFVLVTGVAMLVLWQSREQVIALGYQSLAPALDGVGQMLVWSFLIISSAMLLVAAVDVPFQLWDHARQLRMTRQEVKEEFKNTEGKPEVKSRIRTLQREIAQRRMMEDVPKADVVVVNPSHYSVALRYDAERMDAPRLVASGADLVAFRIREVAASHGVPVVSAPPLARAVYFNTRIGQEIPAALYVAVAQVLAYVFRLREDAAAAGEVPSDLPVPPEMTRGPR